jgi:hypothetical protein
VLHGVCVAEHPNRFTNLAAFFAEQSSVQEEEIDPFNSLPANDNASSTTAVDAAA